MGDSGDTAENTLCACCRARRCLFQPPCQIADVGFDELAPVRQHRLQAVRILQRSFFQNQTVDVPLQGGEVVQVEARRRNGAADHFIGVIEEVAIVRRAASEAGNDAGSGFNDRYARRAAHNWRGSAGRCAWRRLPGRRC